MLTPKFMQSLVEREVIKEEDRDSINKTYDLTDDQRMTVLLSLVHTATKNDCEGNVFLFFLEAMRDQNVTRAKKLADDLKEFHDDKYRYMFPQEFDANGKFVYIDY